MKEGEVVEKGQVLLKIDPTKANASYHESFNKMIALLGGVSRLRAEVYDKPLTFPPEVEAYPDIIRNERESYNSRRRALEQSVSGLERSLAMIENEIEMTTPLVAKGLISDLELIKSKRQSNETRMQITERKNKFIAEATQELARAESELAQARENAIGREDTMRRTLVKAPVKGTVKNIRVTTIGGVIPSATNIMEIVPFEDQLLIEAKILPKDVAFLRPGLDAMVKVAALVSKMDEIVQVIGGRRSELTQAISRLLQSKENRAAAESKLREYEVQLLKLIGAENMGIISGGKMPLIAPILPEAGMIIAKKNHPLLVAAKSEQLAFNDSAIAIRKSNYWPVLEVQASKMSGTDVLGYPNPGRVFATVRWNAFQGFSGRAQEKAVLERANAAQEKYQQTVLDIEYKLNSSWADYQNQHERVISLGILAVNTEQVRNGYYIQWEALGKRSLLEVLTVENEHISTLVSLASSEFDEQLALARLRFDSGTLAAWLFNNEN